MPLINSIEGFGFKFNKEQAQQYEKTRQINLLKDDIISHNKSLTAAEIEKKLENIQKERTDE